MENPPPRGNDFLLEICSVRGELKDRSWTFLKHGLVSTHRHARPEDPRLHAHLLRPPPAARRSVPGTRQAGGSGLGEVPGGLAAPRPAEPRGLVTSKPQPPPQLLLPPVLRPPRCPLGRPRRCLSPSVRWPTVAGALPQRPGTQAPGAQRPCVPERAGLVPFQHGLGRAKGSRRRPRPDLEGHRQSAHTAWGVSAPRPHLPHGGAGRRVPGGPLPLLGPRPLLSARPCALSTGSPGFAGRVDPSPCECIHPSPPHSRGSYRRLALRSPLPTGGCQLGGGKIQGGQSGAKAGPPPGPGEGGKGGKDSPPPPTPLHGDGPRAPRAACSPPNPPQAWWVLGRGALVG